MTQREPQSIEQCAGCGDDVAVYSDRQRVDGEALCSPCRRVHRREQRRQAHQEVKAQEAAAPAVPAFVARCGHERTAVSPKGDRFCQDCFAVVADTRGES